MNVSALLVSFSLWILYSKSKLSALSSKNLGKSPPEFIIVASPLSKLASFLLGVLNALSLNTLIKSYPRTLTPFMIFINSFLR